MCSWPINHRSPTQRGAGRVAPCRLLPWKGVHIGVRAIAALRRSGVEVQLILTDTQRICDSDVQLEDYRREILDLVADLGLDESVEFVSASCAEMAALCHRCDITVYPTIGDEPLGLLPLEAMSCGRPIVAIRNGDIPESISSTGSRVVSWSAATRTRSPARRRARRRSGARTRDRRGRIRLGA